MRGHIRKRGGTWAVVVELPRSADGPRRQKWCGGYKTRRDASHALTELLARLDNGTYVEPNKQSLGDYLDEWTAAIRTTVRASTWRSYRTNIEAHVKRRIGDLPLRSVSPVRLNALYAELLDAGREDGRGGLSPRTVRYTHAIVHRALRDAVRWGRIARNPADLADPPRSQTPQMTVWTLGQLRRFLGAARTDRLWAAWLLMATTGLRRGEVLGLRWEDVDLDGARASIRQVLGSHGGSLVISEPKTAKSKRSIVLDSATVAALQLHKETQEEEQRLWGSAYQPSGLVFQREDGTPVRPDSFSRRFRLLAETAGVPSIRLHDVRHTYATIALSAGTHPKVVAERLGHASIGITLDTYSHVLPSLQEQEATRLAELILGPEASAPPGDDHGQPDWSA